METYTSNGFELAYTRHGHGAPLVLLHGFPLDHTIWNDIIPLLRNDFDLIIPDLPGFGRSSTLHDVYTLDEVAADIAAMLNHLKLGKVHIAGHSMGGYITLAFARAYPARTLGLCLVASQPLADSPEKKASRYANAGQVIEQGASAQLGMVEKLTSDVRLHAALRESILRQPPAGMAGALKAMAERVDQTEFLKSFQLPLAVIHGDADVLIPIERAREIKAAVPNSYLVEVPGVGHMPMMENPPRTAEGLRKLLK